MWSPGQFTHVVKKDKFVFISGQTANPEAEAGNLEPGPQAERVFGYLKSAIEAAGGNMSDAVSTQPRPIADIGSIRDPCAS